MIEFCLHAVKGDEAESLSDLLVHYGALAVTLMDEEDHPVLEPAPGETPLWPVVQIRALFDNVEQVMICECLMLQHHSDLKTSQHLVKDQAWDLAWARDLAPLSFGRRLWVCPSHLSVPDKAAVCVTLNPGLAFGTGTHPTTALCLQWLDAHELTDQVVLDYGCGSGILMIASLKLGARFAYGIDLDPQAVTATRENAIVNEISPEQYQVGLVDDNIITQPVQLIIANILFNPLLALKKTFHAMLEKEGYLVISGILSNQVPAMIDAYALSFQLVETHLLEEWALLVFAPKPSFKL